MILNALLGALSIGSDRPIEKEQRAKITPNSWPTDEALKNSINDGALSRLPQFIDISDVEEQLADLSHENLEAQYGFYGFSIETGEFKLFFPVRHAMHIPSDVMKNILDNKVFIVHGEQTLLINNSFKASVPSFYA